MKKATKKPELKVYNPKGMLPKTSDKHAAPKPHRLPPRPTMTRSDYEAFIDEGAIELAFLWEEHNGPAIDPDEYGAITRVLESLFVTYQPLALQRLKK